MTLSPTRRREANLIIGIAALYLFLWLLLPKPAFWGVDSGFKFQGMKAFAETGKIVIPNPGLELGIALERRSIQIPFGFAVPNGQIVVFSPLFQVLGGLLLLIFGNVGPFFLPLIGGWGILLASWNLWLRQRENHDGSIFLLLVGVGSPIMFYSMELWEHTLATAALTYAIALLCPYRSDHYQPDDSKGIFIAGLLLGVAAGLRTEIIIWGLIVFIFWKGTGRTYNTRMKYVFGLLTALAAIGVINFWQTGAPYPLHILSNLLIKSPSGLMGLAITRTQNIYLLILQGFPSNILSVAGLIPLTLVILWVNWRYDSGWWPFISGGVVLAAAFFIYSIFSAPNPVAYTSESGGLLWIVPISILAIMPLRWERRKFWNLIWSGVMLTILMLAAFSPAIKGIHWGPRHLVFVIPFILMFATVRIQRWWSRHHQTRMVVIVLVAISIINQFIGYSLNYRARHFNRQLNNWAQKYGDNPVLMRSWWMPGDCSLASYSKPWFIVHDGQALREVIDALRGKGITRLSFIDALPYIPNDVFALEGLKEVKAESFQRYKSTLNCRTFEISRIREVPEEVPAPVGIQDAG